ncbi:hypothetical protein C8R44DRAFT_943085 [Mycena epipterygia]|nr:hypothetical protein C8R44DRAFT_943085 [Mycena epipterygia]
MRGIDGVSLPARSSGGSYDSRCHQPHVSPVQLPLLFVDENTATPDPAAGESVQQPVDEEHSDDDEQKSSPPATQGLDILSWTAGALTDVNETKLHQHISLRSQSSDSTSYAQAPPYIQRDVRQLLTQFPRFQADAITPTELPLPCSSAASSPPAPTRFPAPAPLPRPTSRLATGPSACPACPAKKGPIQAGSMGQHLLTHAAEREVMRTPSVRCKLCDCESTDMHVLVERFRAYQVPFTPLQARPHKRQRFDSGSGRSSDVRV